LRGREEVEQSETTEWGNTPPLFEGRGANRKLELNESAAAMRRGVIPFPSMRKREEE